LAAGFGERFAAGEQAWAGSEALGDGLGESVGRAAEIATVLNPRSSMPLRMDKVRRTVVAEGSCWFGGEVHHAGDDVDVAIDEARDDGAGFEVDDPAGGGGYAGVEVADEAAFNEDVAGARVRAGRVDDEAFCRRVCVVR